MSGAHPAPSGRSVAWSLVAVVSAAAMVVTLPAAPEVQDTASTPDVEPVSRTALSCPPGDPDARVEVASAAGTARRRQVRGEVTVEQHGGEPRAGALRRGRLTSLPVGPAPVEVLATGGAARGLLAARVERGDGALAAAACVGAQPVWWFSGAGGGVDHSSVLLLRNRDEGPAVVDVRLHGATGSVDEAGLRGVTLAPGETKRLPLTQFAPGSDELTVEVVTTRGRIAAHLTDTVRTSGGEGREWLAPTPPPAEELVLPGVPAGANRVELLVSNPGSEQALVELELLTPRGAFVPLGTEQLSVDPGTNEQVDLTEALRGRASAVRLTSPVPVTGVVRVTQGGDAAYAAAGTALTGPSGVVLAGDESVVQVAAADEPVAVQLHMYAADGRRLLRRAVTVPPSGLVGVPAPDGAAYAVLMPGSGRGYAAAAHTGRGVAGQPLMPLPTTVLRPSVEPYAGQSDS